MSWRSVCLIHGFHGLRTTAEPIASSWTSGLGSALAVRLLVAAGRPGFQPEFVVGHRTCVAHDQQVASAACLDGGGGRCGFRDGGGSQIVAEDFGVAGSTGSVELDVVVAHEWVPT